MKDQSRNLNPTPEAVIAMSLWGARYAAQRGGSMDFWDDLPEADKRLCLRLLERIREAEAAHVAPQNSCHGSANEGETK